MLDLPVVVTGSPVRSRATTTGFALYGGHVATDGETPDMTLRETQLWVEATWSPISIERMLGSTRYHIERAGHGLRVTLIGAFVVEVSEHDTHSRLTCTLCGWKSRIWRLRRNARFMLGEQLQHACPNHTVIIKGDHNG